MPADDTLTLIANYYAAFNAEDDEGMLRLLSDDIIHDINQGGRETGKPMFRSFLQRMRRCYRERLEQLVFAASKDGKRGSAEYVVHGTYLEGDEGLPPARGQSYTLPGGAFFSVEHGLITRVTNYYNLQAWLEQV